MLVMDLAEEGDLTKRMMGGVDASKEKVQELFGGVFSLLQDAQGKTSGLTSWLWNKTLDLGAHAVQVSQHNDNIPSNLYLISSGAWPRAEQEMDVKTRKTLCEKILQSFQASDKTWKLFCDTDGDRRPSLFTKIGYGLCPHAIVPLHLNKGDLERTYTMLGVLNELRQAGEISTQVAFVVWNFVNSNKNSGTTHKGLSLPFEMTKVNYDILDACNQRLWDVRGDLPGVFVHEDKPQEEFVNSTVCVLRSIADNALRPSEELGKPFVKMFDELQGKKSLKFTCESIEYTVGEDVLKGVKDGVDALAARFGDLSVQGGYPGR